MMLRRLHTATSFVLATAVLTLVLTACSELDGQQQQAAPPPPAVTVATPLVKRITEWDEFTGRFEATESVEVRARVSGYLQSVNFADGAMVKEGDVLFMIDPRPYQAAVDQAKADLASAQARLDWATVELDRAEALVKSNTVSTATYDERLQERRTAEGAVQQATAVAAGGAAQSRLHPGQGADLRTRLRPPRRHRQSGDRRPERDAADHHRRARPDLFHLRHERGGFPRLSARRRTAARCPRPATTRRSSRRSLPDEEDWPHSGTMNFVDNRIEPGSGTIRARAVLPNPDLFITPGQFGRLRIPGSNPYDADPRPRQRHRDRPVEPHRHDGDGGRHGRAEGRSGPGPSQPGGLRIVREGLTGDEKIIINGLVRARPGRQGDAGARHDRARSRSRRRTEGARHALLAFLHRPADLRDGPVDPHHAARRASPISRCRSRNIRRSRRRRSRSAPAIPAPRPRSSPTRSRRRSSRRSTASRTCSTCPRRRPATASSRITVTFKLGTDLDTAQVLVQNRVAVAEPRLPEEVRRIGVTVRKTSPDMLMVVHLSSPDGSRDPLYISNYATLQVRDVLARLDGVGDVRIFGARDYAMRIWLDPEKVAARNLTAGEVVAALRAQNVQVASGVLNQPPVPRAGRLPAQRRDARAADRAAPVRRHRRQDRRRTAASRGSRDVAPRRARGAGLHAPTAISTSARPCRS